MNRNLEKLLWLAVVIQAVGLVLDILLRLAAGVVMVQISIPFTMAGLLVCLVAAWRERLTRRSLEEKQDRAAIGDTTSHSLFAMTPEAETPFSAAQQLRQYERFVLPALPFMLAAICGAGAVWLAAIARTPAMLLPDSPPVAGFLAGRAFVVFLLHRVLLAISHRPEGEPVRAPAIWLGLTALAACFGAGIVLADSWADTALTGPALLTGSIVAALLATEALLTGVTGFYKSHTARARLRASRLGTLLCDPSVWAHSLAGALDYQFGYRISETTLYRTARRLVLPLLVLQLLLLLFSHCLVILEPHEAAVIEVMGRPATDRILQSGYHLVLPPPWHRIRRYPINRIQTLQVGFDHHDDHNHHQDVKLWSEEHHDDEHDFLVAAHGIDRERDLFAPDAAGHVPVTLLSISLNMEVQITNLVHYMTAYRDPAKLLRQSAARLLMLEAGNADVFDLMGPGQQALAERMKRRLEDTVRELNLGLEIRAVNLLGIHPPVAVAGAYEMVIGADEMYEAAILEGNSYRIRRLPAANAEAYEHRQSAAAERDARMTTAAAEAALFVSRADAARIAPLVYPMRTFLDLMEARLPHTTRHLIAAPADADVIEIDFTHKPYDGLLDAAGRLERPDPGN